MKRKTKPPLNPLNVAFIIAGFRLVRDPLVHRLGIDHPDVQKATVAYIENLKRQYDRKIRAQALRLRRRWRKADVPRLLQLLDGRASPATQRRIARVMLAEGLGGRGVIPTPKTFDQAFSDSFAVGLRIADPATSSTERFELRKKNMPKYPDLIEAAYRGELAKSRRKINDGKLPHLKASEIAEEKVAEVAGISRPLVHQLCQEVRDATKREKNRGNVMLDEPAMTAADLRRHLESGPADLGPS